MSKGKLNMKKTMITLSYDEEKLNALRMYIGQKNTQVEDRLKRLGTPFKIDRHEDAAPASVLKDGA